MKNILTKYKALPNKYQIGIALTVFIVGLIVLPNTIVYLAGVFLSYKLIDKKSWKYVSVGLFCLVSFFSAILLFSEKIPATQDVSIKEKVISVEEQQKSVDTTQENTSSSEMSKDTENKTSDTQSDTQTNNDIVQSVKSEQQTQVSQYTYYSVSEVVDGDTVKINMNGKVETLRLIGLDTPETVDPRKPVQCFGKEASNKAKELLSGKKVRIETDPTQGERDKYNRLLAYIYREDGMFYNKYMIEQGYAHEYTYNTPYKYQSDFKTAQKNAQASQVGLWSPNTCNGDTTSSSEQTPPVATQSSGKFYTSSHYSSKYWYPEACDGWKGLSASYLKSYETLEALLSVYPSKTKSPQCE